MRDDVASMGPLTICQKVDPVLNRVPDMNLWFFRFEIVCKRGSTFWQIDKPFSCSDDDVASVGFWVWTWLFAKMLDCTLADVEARWRTWFWSDYTGSRGQGVGAVRPLGGGSRSAVGGGLTLWQFVKNLTPFWTVFHIWNFDFSDLK